MDRSAFRVAGRAAVAGGGTAGASTGNGAGGCCLSAAALAEQEQLDEQQLASMRLAQELLDLGLPLPDFESPESLLDTLDRCVDLYEDSDALMQRDTVQNALANVNLECDSLMIRVLDKNDARAHAILDHMLAETPEFAAKPLPEIIEFLNRIATS